MSSSFTCASSMTHEAVGAVLHKPKDRGDGVADIDHMRRRSAASVIGLCARARRSQASSLRDDPVGLTGLTPTARVRGSLLRRPPRKRRALRAGQSHIGVARFTSSDHLLSVWHACHHLLLHPSCDVGDCRGASLPLQSRAHQRAPAESRATRTSSGRGSVSPCDRDQTRTKAPSGISFVIR
jgi:hypothetical protein